jgi:3-hydroxyacyl-CoA dehydrogenase
VSFPAHLGRLAVIGAGGKMGRGICLMLIKAILAAKLKPSPKLVMVEVQGAVFESLSVYLRAQLDKCIQKDDCPWTSHLGDSPKAREKALNQELENILAFHGDMDALGDRSLIFEAVPEVPSLKIKLLQQIAQHTDNQSFVFSNTSSIPIAFLEREAELQGRLVGFHFYNPPPVQKLLELIHGPEPSAPLSSLANSTVAALGKSAVMAKDVAGFIGNGHFIREGLHCLAQVGSVSDSETAKALLRVNHVTEFGCLRPMGMFQLIDYVGLDVFQCIAAVMKEHLGDDSLHSPLLDQFLTCRRSGGQDVRGGQRNGIFSYQERRITAIYDPVAQREQPLDAEFIDSTWGSLGLEQAPLRTWKVLKGSADLKQDLEQHFSELVASGSEFARKTLQQLAVSRAIAEQLLEDGVASSPSDIDTVMTRGFQHLFGPMCEHGLAQG